MGPLNPELAGEKVTLAGCMPGMGVGHHLLRLPSWEPRVALPHETIPRTKTWADGGKVGQCHDALGHPLLKGTRASTSVCPCLPRGPTRPLLFCPSATGPARTTSWVSPSGHGPRSFFCTISPQCLPVVTPQWLSIALRIKTGLLTLAYKVCHRVPWPL